MQPQTFMQNSSRTRLLALIAAVLAVIGIGMTYYQVFVFHQTGSDPSLAAVSNISPYLKLSYNQDLDPASLQLQDPSHILSQKIVKGKSVTLMFAHDLIVDRNYQITVVRIANKKGTIISNRVLKFTAKDIPVSKLSKEQQKTIVSQQDQYPYAVDFINYRGFDELLSNGMSASQLQSVKESLFYYSQSIKQKYWVITVVSGSVQVQLHDQDSANSNDTQTFGVVLGNTTLRAVATYSLLDDTAQLQLYTTSGALVYDSANAHD